MTESIAQALFHHVVPIETSNYLSTFTDHASRRYSIPFFFFSEQFTKYPAFRIISTFLYIENLQACTFNPLFALPVHSVIDPGRLYIHQPDSRKPLFTIVGILRSWNITIDRTQFYIIPEFSTWPQAIAFFGRVLTLSKVTTGSHHICNRGQAWNAGALQLWPWEHV